MEFSPRSYMIPSGLKSCSIWTKSSLDYCSSNHNPFWILYRTKRKSCPDLNLEKIPGYELSCLIVRFQIFMETLVLNLKLSYELVVALGRARVGPSFMARINIMTQA
jgi:hypothetical protein